MSDKITLNFELNGRQVSADINTEDTLVEVLRSEFQLYGAKESCGQGLCGACTVIVDGLAVSGCLTLAATVEGASVKTIEGMGNPENLHPIQEAFVEARGHQCGFCTPGMVLMASQLLEEKPQPTDEEIKHYMTGNLCRCASYPEIIDSVKLASTKLKGA